MIKQEKNLKNSLKLIISKIRIGHVFVWNTLMEKNGRICKKEEENVDNNSWTTKRKIKNANRKLERHTKVNTSKRKKEENMEKKSKENSKREKSKGVTLIALVITIIVLLILAGVTIATLTGQNGILTNATTAKEKTQYSTAEEKVKLALVGSYDATGDVSKSKFETEVSRQGGTSSIEGTEATVQIDGYSFLVNLETGEMEQIETGPVEQPEKQIANGIAIST